MSLAAQVTAAGIVAPSYADILASLIATFQSIYGTDAYIQPDSQDGQLLAVFASAINDTNQMAVAVYNSFSPAYAQGAGLSSMVKINGLKRESASNSTAAIVIVGQANNTINNGVVQDTLKNNWNLPTVVTIPNSGTITVTATAAVEGAIAAAANTITTILTPTLGWQTVNNPAAAAVGLPVELDYTLRLRQASSTALPALSVLDALISAIGNVPGVGRYRVYENPTGSTDGNGLPAHSISPVVEGGVVQTIANTIAQTKTPGTPTYGSTSTTVVDSAGIPSTINYYVLAEVPITVQIDITKLAGYVATTGTAIVAALVATLSTLGIGVDAYLTRLYTAANLNGSPLGLTYNVTGIRIARGVASPTAADVVIAFNEAATAQTSNITLTTT